MYGYIELGVRWQAIPAGNNNKKDNKNTKAPSNMDIVQALYVECDKDVFLVIKSILSDIYAKSVRIFPGGMKMRFVPYINTIPNPVTQGKIMHLCAKQVAFLRIVKEMTSYEIMSFDWIRMVRKAPCMIGICGYYLPKMKTLPNSSMFL